MPTQSRLTYIQHMVLMMVIAVVALDYNCGNHRRHR